MASDLGSFGMVGVEVLDFSYERGVILFAQGPVDKVGELHPLG